MRLLGEPQIPTQGAWDLWLDPLSEPLDDALDVKDGATEAVEGNYALIPFEDDDGLHSLNGKFELCIRGRCRGRVLNSQQETAIRYDLGCVRAVVEGDFEVRHTQMASNQSICSLPGSSERDMVLPVFVAVGYRRKNGEWVVLNPSLPFVRLELVDEAAMASGDPFQHPFPPRPRPSSSVVALAIKMGNGARVSLETGFPLSMTS